MKKIVQEVPREFVLCSCMEQTKHISAHECDFVEMNPLFKVPVEQFESLFVLPRSESQFFAQAADSFRLGRTTDSKKAVLVG